MTASRFVLYHHPFASVCQKVLIGLYERGLEFTSVVVEDRADRDALRVLWPMGTIPVLRDEAAGITLPESTSILEYVDRLAEGPPLVPCDAASALQARLWDRICDASVELPVRRIVADALRPVDGRDPLGVAEARETLDRAYGVLETQLGTRPWVAGDTFTIADCGAAPVLLYARVVHPWNEAVHPQLTRYYRALMHRPSVDRVIEEARPLRALLPLPWPANADDHRPGRKRA